MILLNKTIRRFILSLALICAGITAAQAATLTVTTTSDTNGVCNSGVNCSLREAIAAAASGDTIVFASPTFDSPQTININSELTIDKNLTVTGRAANLLTVRNTASNNRVFVIDSSSVNLSGMTMTGGNTDFGGGILNNAGTLALTGVHITGNTALRGAGILNVNSTLTITNSTISGNTAAGYDISNAGTSGGIENLGGTLTVTNTTISGNRVTGFNFNGGGIFNTGNSVTVTNSTITRNEAAGANSAGGVLSRTGTTTIRNSIIASNCALVLNATCGTNDPPDVGVVPGSSSTFTSNGYNLIGRRGTVTNFNQTGDQTGTNAAPIDPRLYPLRDNGGATPTHALRANSTAINPASSNGAPATDQRGAPRPFGATADIGAFEFLPMVTNINDSGAGSLRQTVADVPADGFVIFDDLFRIQSNIIDLPNGQITINKNLSIVGLGANVLTVRNTQAQSQTSRVFNIQGGIVRLAGLTITGGNLSFNGNAAGGIYNRGSLTVFACHITGNTDDSSSGGGGIYNDGAALTVINSTVSGNTATGGSNSGGGIRNNSNGTLNIINSTVSGNRTTGGNLNGGGILAIGNAVISNSTVTDNETPNGAGGISKFNGTTVTIRNSIVAGNCTRTTGAICSQAATPDVFSFGGDYTSQGYNLIGNAGTAGGFNQTGDQTGTSAAPLNPQLAPLADNGGTTPTHSLLGTSPAIDKGNCFGCSLDQRGAARQLDFPNFPNASGGDGSDIGALELQLAPTAAAVSISGQVIISDGRGLMNARVMLIDQNGTTRTAMTTSFGYFHFTDVPAGETVVISVISKRYTFAPQVLNVTEDFVELNFSAIQLTKSLQESFNTFSTVENTLSDSADFSRQTIKNRF